MPLNYSDGQEVRLGDRVRLAADNGGVVVCLIDTGEYTDRYPREQWEYLNKGALIEFPLFGLIHYDVVEDDVELIERAPEE